MDSLDLEIFFGAAGLRNAPDVVPKLKVMGSRRVDRVIADEGRVSRVHCLRLGTSHSLLYHSRCLLETLGFFEPGIKVIGPLTV